MKTKLLFLFFSLAAPLHMMGALGVTHLRVCSLTAPLGIDTPTPTFSWELTSDERGYLQTSYLIKVCDAAGHEVWDSGTISSSKQTAIAYGGTALKSCSAYTWSVCITDNQGRSATAASTFETAFLQPEEWSAQWIGKNEASARAMYEVVLSQPVTCRYVRLNVTELGLRAAADPGFSFVQMDEVEIYEGDENVARTAIFTASNSWSLPQYGWDLKNVNDGRIGDAAALGWTTQQNPSTPVTLTADL